MDIVGQAGLGHGVGFYLGDQANIRTSGGGAITVTGTGRDGVSKGGNQGTVIAGGSRIEALGTGAVSATGTGGSTSGGWNHRVHLLGSNSTPTSSGVHVAVSGQVAGTADSCCTYGVTVQTLH